MSNGIKVKCKRCGRDAPSDSFVLDPIYGMLVCPNCVSERKSKIFSDKLKAQHEKEKEIRKEQEEQERPKGWDADDAYLEKAYKMKESTTVAVEKIDDEKVKISCPKCKYRFVYNAVKNIPSRCPYCDAAIPKFRS